MDENNSIFHIRGDDFIQYNSEDDWVGNYFYGFPNASVLKNFSGIYAFTLCGEVVYVGSSVNLFNRFRTHIISIQHGDNCKSPSIADRKYYYLNKYIENVEFKVLATYDKHMSKQDLEQREHQYINIYQPIFNVNYMDKVKRWCGSDRDIDEFVNGNTTIADLQRQMKSMTKL